MKDADFFALILYLDAALYNVFCKNTPDVLFHDFPTSSMSVEVNKSSPSCHQCSPYASACVFACSLVLFCGETAVSGGSQSSTFLFLGE